MQRHYRERVITVVCGRRGDGRRGEKKTSGLGSMDKAHIQIIEATEVVV